MDIKKPETQIDAWYDLQSTISRKRQIVLNQIRIPSTLFEISEKLNWPINRVSGRVTELKNLNLIEDSGLRRKNPLSGKNGIVWKLNNNYKLGQ